MGTVDSVARLLALSAGNGSGGGEASNYNDLANKPQINGTTLTGDKTLDELGITADNLNVYTKEETTNVINDATSGKADKTALGNLSDLATDDKSSAVAAINEIKEKGTKASNIDNLTITENENGTIQAVGVLNDKDKETLVKLWTGTKAEYDAIEEKDDATLYNITDDYEEPEIVANKTTIIDANSTDTQYPSAKAVYDIIQNNFDGDAALDNIVPKQTATDDIININDALKYKTFNFKVDGNYEQKTSDGSNLLNIDYSEFPKDGAELHTELNDDYSFTVTGTKTTTNWNNVPFSLKTPIYFKTGVKYYIKDVIVFLYNTDGKWVKNIDTDFTADQDYIAEDVPNVKGAYWTTNKQGTINETIRPYVGTVPYDESKYYKYTGGIASPNPNYPQEITPLSFDKITEVGQNLYNVRDAYTEGYDPYNSAYQVDEDDWVTLDIQGAPSDYNYYSLYTNNLKLKPDTDYNIILEVKEKSGLGTLSVVSQRIEGETQVEGQFNGSFSNSFGNFGPGIYTKKLRTLNKEELENTVCGLRTFISLDKGNYSSMTFRISVIEDTSVTPENFVYQPYQETNYQIDLQGNEMVSLPNGVKDEVQVDKEGNVNLIKKIGKKTLLDTDVAGIEHEWFSLVSFSNVAKPLDYIGEGTYALDESYNNIVLNRFYQSPDSAPRETYDKIYSIIPYMSGWSFGITFPKNTTIEEAKGMIDGTILYYQLKEPQTISLGKLSDLITTEQGSNTFAINGNIDTNINTTYALDIKKYIDNKIAAISSAVLEQE